MLQKLSSNRYTLKVVEQHTYTDTKYTCYLSDVNKTMSHQIYQGDGTYVYLLEIIDEESQDRRKKTFTLRGEHKIENLIDHMNSLTDSQIEQWFNAGQRPKKKDKKSTQPS